MQFSSHPYSSTYLQYIFLNFLVPIAFLEGTTNTEPPIFCIAAEKKKRREIFVSLFFVKFMMEYYLYFVNIKIKIVYFLIAPHSQACKIISAAAHENNTLGKTWAHSVI